MVVPLIEGKTSFQGYRGRKEDSEKRILRDVFTKGDIYFNSGDLMRVDRDYFLYFHDRVGDTFRWDADQMYCYYCSLNIKGFCKHIYEDVLDVKMDFL